MNTNPTKDAERSLHQIALNQEGYFTAKQAKSAGYADSTHLYHVKNGDWTKELRGIYRISDFPYVSDRPELTMWQLWSRNNNEIAQGTFSYETALDLYDLSDNIPHKIHITVPKKFRKSEVPKILQLHYENLKPSDIQNKNGVQVTSIPKTFLDLIDSQTISTSLISQGLEQAFKRGLLLHSDLTEHSLTGSDLAKKTLLQLASKLQND